MRENEREGERESERERPREEGMGFLACLLHLPSMDSFVLLNCSFCLNKGVVGCSSFYHCMCTLCTWCVVAFECVRLDRRTRLYKASSWAGTRSEPKALHPLREHWRSVHSLSRPRLLALSLDLCCCPVRRWICGR